MNFKPNNNIYSYHFLHIYYVMYIICVPEINIVLCSPLKADFIRAKYQMLAFVNKQKDVDLSSPEDLSQVRHSLVQYLLTSFNLMGTKPRYIGV